MNRYLVSVGTVSALLAVAAASCHPGGAHEGQTGDPLIGAWTLASLEEVGAGGALHHADATGSLVFTREGRMSVQVMYRSVGSPTDAGPVQYAQGGYEASFGRYVVDAPGRSFTYHVEGALVRSLVGNDLKRVYELDGKRLVVKPSSPDERWRVTWERSEERP